MSCDLDYVDTMACVRVAANRSQLAVSSRILNAAGKRKHVDSRDRFSISVAFPGTG